ncbi:MAG: hypothetical protein ACE5JJ_10940, partial [Nitrospinota bacterium]
DAACLAGGSGLVVSQTEATNRATAIGNQNINQTVVLTGSDLSVSFPTTDTIRTTVSNPAVPLLFARAIGWQTAPVSATASCGIAPAGSVPDLVPLGVYCNNPTDCAGVLAVEQTWILRRYCGNFFTSGNSDACGNNFQAGDVFLIGITFDESSNSNSRFRQRVYNGYDIQVDIGDIGRALPGNRNGWRHGMENRLLEGRYTMVLPVIRGASVKRDIQVTDFVAVEVSNFRRVGNTDETTFRITQNFFSTTQFATSSQGYGINSVVGVRLIQ